MPLETHVFFDQYLQNIQAASVMVEPTPDASIIGVSSDPDDDLIIATAMAASAVVLCTLDRHLYSPKVIGHCQQHRIEVLGDVELLQRLKSAAT